MEIYGECFLLEDSAAAHIAWENKEEYDIPGLNRIKRPANSPDLNIIEQAWYYLKQSVTEILYIVSNTEQCMQAWQEVWEQLNQEIIEH